MMAEPRQSFAGQPAWPPAPLDFDETFVRIGRLACEAHFNAARVLIDAWLRERGKKRLIEEREKHVRARDDAERQAKQLGRLTRGTARTLLAEAFRDPIPDHRRVSLTLTRHAAQHLRIRRYGGFIVSQAPNGDWRIGTKRVSAAQLVDIAIAKGFTPSLTGDE